jgi:hypothetical protein
LETPVEAALYAFVKTYLFIPSALFEVIYKLGPVAAPLLGLALTAVFPFIALNKERKSQ